MRLTKLLALLTALTIAGRAEAHAFQSGADAYAQFLEGVGVVLAYPSLLLPLMALGILLSLWSLEGLPKVWPVFLAALVAGMAIAGLVGPAVTLVLMALGIAVAVLAATLPRHIWAEAAGLTALTGLLVAASGLEGHGFFELGAFIYIGIFFGANLALAMSASLTRLALERSAAPWVRIGARVAASWIGAILMLILAFALTNP